MVRMCHTMTLACATLLVAGSVHAADKAPVAKAAPRAAAPAVEVKAPELTLRRAHDFNLDSSLFGGGDSACLCVGWDNGSWDGRDGQLSHLGGGVPNGAKAADDFYLCKGEVHDLQSISGVLITNSIAGLRKAKLELYADCDGCPGELLYTFSVHEAPVVGRNLGGGYFEVTYTFVIANQPSPDNNIVLHGGAYWVSLIGKTDNQCLTMGMCDKSYFATTGNGNVKGAVAKKIEGIPTGVWGQFSFPANGWESVDECCIGCTDLAFVVCANPCKVLKDNGGVDRFRTSGELGSRSERSTTTWNNRSADDFVVNPCSDFTVCYIEGCIYTNCDIVRGFFEIYDNDCKEPSYVVGAQVPAGRSGLSTKAVDLGFSVVIEGRTLRAYRVEFHDLNITLPRGRHYWLSIGNQDTFSFNERAYFCRNYVCGTDCDIMFNPGVFWDPTLTGHPPVANGWTSVGYDFSFKIAGNYANSSSGGGGNSGATCAADYNNDGASDLVDLLDFLSAWLPGCP